MMKFIFRRGSKATKSSFAAKYTERLKREREIERIYHHFKGVFDFLCILENTLKKNTQAVALGCIGARECNINIGRCNWTIAISDLLTGHVVARELNGYYKKSQIIKAMPEVLAEMFKEVELYRTWHLENGKFKQACLFNFLADVIERSRKAAPYVITAVECNFYPKRSKLIVVIHDDLARRDIKYESPDKKHYNTSQVKKALPRILRGLLNEAYRRRMIDFYC